MNDEILENFEIRKSNNEKTAFIDYLKHRLLKSGYDPEKDIWIESRWKGLFKTRNIIVGNPDTSSVLITAHYDTCAVLPFPNFMAPTNPFLFICSQILITVVILLFSSGIGIGLALLADDPSVGYPAFLAALMLLLFESMVGLKNKHTANDNTSGTITLTRLLESVPQEHRSKICAVYFDNEEKGLFGSDFFASRHRDIRKNKMLINFDCVGDGEYIVTMAKKDAIKDENYDLLLHSFQSAAALHDVICLNNTMKPMMFPSDQIHFNKGIGVCALRKSPFGLYCGRIHTPFDTKCREENIAFLTRAMTDFIEHI